MRATKTKRHNGSCFDSSINDISPRFFSYIQLNHELRTGIFRNTYITLKMTQF